MMPDLLVGGGQLRDGLGLERSLLRLENLLPEQVVLDGLHQEVVVDTGCK